MGSAARAAPDQTSSPYQGTPPPDCTANGRIYDRFGMKSLQKIPDVHRLYIWIWPTLGIGDTSPSQGTPPPDCTADGALVPLLIIAV